MGTLGEVPLKQIEDMLRGCAPGYRLKFREHNICVYYGDLVYPSLPVGRHGKRENPAIQIGHIKNLVRAFQLDHDCVRRFLPQLKLKPSDAST